MLSVTLEGHANPKESREQRAELWESAPRVDGGVPKDGDEVRLLTESVSESDRNIV